MNVNINAKFAIDDSIAMNESTKSRFMVDKVNVDCLIDVPLKKSHLTLEDYVKSEAPPRVDHYRNVNSIHTRVNRPTLEELHVGRVANNLTVSSINF